MAQGSRFSSYFVKETSSGVTPSSPAFNIFRATGSSLDINIATLESDEIRDDAETSDFRLGSRSVGGTISAEMSFGTFDELIAAVLRGSWTANTVKGGIERQSFTFVDYQADLPEGKYTIYRGCEINSIALTVSAESMTTVEFGVIGRSMEIAETLPTGSTLKSRTTTSPMDGFQGTLRESGVASAVITELSLNIDNGITPRFVVGSKFSILPGATRRNVTGTVNSYFEDNKLRNKFLNETETNIEFELIDPATPTQKYIFKIPRLKFTEASRPVDGEGDIMLNLSYQGLWNSADNTSIIVTRVPVASGSPVKTEQ